MNRIERAAYNLLIEHPRAKSALTSCYRFGCYWLPSSEIVRVTALTHLPSLFFGFHDKSPWSPDNRLVLAHRFTGSDSAKIRAQGPVEVGHVDTSSGHFTPLGLSHGHNWQLGSMLQWRFDIGHERQALYQDVCQGRIITHLIDLEGRCLTQFPFPVSATDRSGRYAVLINPAMHGMIEPQYGYAGVTSPCSTGVPLGLSVLTLESSEAVTTVTLDELTERLTPSDRLTEDETYISHPQFSPNGGQVSFFVRQKLGQMRHRTYLVTLQIHTGTFSVANLSDYVSHYCWLNDSQIIVYSRDTAGKYGYFIVDPISGSSSRLGWISDMGDGHPQAHFGSSMVITDTYPDRHGLQHLLLLDLRRKAVTRLLSLKIPLRFRGPRRCDFHPRWDRLGRNVCLDSAHSGRRSLCIFDLDAAASPETQNDMNSVTVLT